MKFNSIKVLKKQFDPEDRIEKTLQSAFGQALDLISPEWLGRGFSVKEISDNQIEAKVPFKKDILHFKSEMNQGLVTNACLEMATAFLKKQTPEKFMQIKNSEFNLKKYKLWSTDLIVVMTAVDEQLDQFFFNLQKFKQSTLSFTFQVFTENTSQHRTVVGEAILNLTIQRTELIS